MIGSVEKTMWVVIWAVVLAVAAAIMAMPASAHLTSYPAAVDPDSTGGHMPMRDITHYNTAYEAARTDWGALNCDWGLACEGVYISTTTDAAVSNVDWSDYNDCTNTAVGSYAAYVQPKKITINACRMEPKTVADREGVGLHEAGHALKHEHVPGTWSPASSVMYPDTSGANVLTDHDRSDYHSTVITNNRWDTTP